MDKKLYLRFIANFMVVLILTIPFYVSTTIAAIDENNPLNSVNTNSFPSVTGAQVLNPKNTTLGSVISVEDAVESCIEKNEKTHALVEALDNDIIKVLEQIFSVLHAINAVWEATKQGLNLVILSLWTAWATGFCSGCDKSAKALEKVRNIRDNPENDGLMMLVNYVLGCSQPKIPWCQTSVKVPGDISVTISKSPFNNIYTAIGCLCIPAILFNIRKLKTIYQTYNCCVEQACQNGVSVEACERQLSEAQCMYWGKGAILTALVEVVISLVSQIIAQILIKKLVDKYSGQLPPWIGTLFSLANLPFAWENLQAGLKWMDKTFSEPKCEDLGFEKLRKEKQEELKRSRTCTTKRIDTNKDGKVDRIETICT